MKFTFLGFYGVVLVKTFPLMHQLEGKYTEWPNPQKAENHACDRQSGLSDSAP